MIATNKLQTIMFDQADVILVCSGTFLLSNLCKVTSTMFVCSLTKLLLFVIAI